GQQLPDELHGDIDLRSGHAVNRHHMTIRGSSRTGRAWRAPAGAPARSCRRGTTGPAWAAPPRAPTRDRGAMKPREPALPRPLALRLAATESTRCTEAFRSLRLGQWAARTDCPAWNVRQMAAHMLGMAEMAASIRESLRQQRKATRAGGTFIDALNQLQVDERRDWTPERITERYAARAPRAVAAPPGRRGPGPGGPACLPSPPAAPCHSSRTSTAPTSHGPTAISSTSSCPAPRGCTAWTSRAPRAPRYT